MTDLTKQEALEIWGPINQQAAKEKAERGEFWKAADGGIEGEVVKVYTRLNFDKNGQEPALDIVVKNGKRVVASLSNKVIRDKVAEKQPQVGDYVSIKNVHKPAGKKYWDADVTVTRDGKPVEGANQSEPPF